VLKDLIKLDMATVDHRGRRGWSDKINHARSEIRHLLASAPCLRPAVQAVIDKSLGCAKMLALKELRPGKRRAIDLAALSYRAEQVVENWFPKPPRPSSEELVEAQLELELEHKSPLRWPGRGDFRLIEETSVVVVREKFALAEKPVGEICAGRGEKREDEGRLMARPMRRSLWPSKRDHIETRTTSAFITPNDYGNALNGPD
jgi:hypothetical protein